MASSKGTIARLAINKPKVEVMEPSKSVLICQNRTCRKMGATKVLAAFQISPIPEDITVKGSGCLGECGNGPMVLVLPEQIWYSSVHPDEVLAIVERHLIGGKPISAMLYRKFHPDT